MFQLGKWTSALKFYDISPALANLQDDRGEKLQKQQAWRGWHRRLGGKTYHQSKNKKPQKTSLLIPPKKKKNPHQTKQNSLSSQTQNSVTAHTGFQDWHDKTRSEICGSLFSRTSDKYSILIADIFNVKRQQQGILGFLHLSVDLVPLTSSWSSLTVDFSKIFTDTNIHRQDTSDSYIRVYGFCETHLSSSSCHPMAWSSRQFRL